MMGTAAEAAANTAAAVAGATGNGSKGSANGDDWDAGGGCEGTREQCAVRDPSRDGTRGPGHTGNTDPANTGSTDTGNRDGQPDTGPNHTGNNQASGQAATNTGNTEGVPDTGGNTTVTPIPQGPNKDDFIYMSDGHMLGANGVKVPSKTIWKGEGKERIDVENPNPGQRPGQVHYQDNKNNKYYYNPNSNDFYSFDASKNKIPAPSSVNKLLEDPKFKQAIDKGMKQYLGEK